MAQVLLFVYGDLRPDLNPPESMEHYKEDFVLGELLEYDGEIQVVLGGRDKVDGYVMAIDDSEFLKLDTYEGDNYSRVRTRTGSKLDTWIYVKKLEEV